MNIITTQLREIDMKKTLIAITLMLALLLLCSCGKKKYEPVPSTDEEAQVVLTLSVGDKRYDVRYELYRALFIGNKGVVDRGDNSVWQGDNSTTYIEQINEIIIDRAAEIYSVLHIADSLGIDLYSNDVDEKIQEYIDTSVNGNDSGYEGCGSYEKYLEYLSDQGMNYAVSDLLFRYSFGVSEINKYYKGTESVLGDYNGNLEFDEEDVRAFYEGSESVRLLQAYFQNGVRTQDQMLDFRNSLAEKNDVIDKAEYIIHNTSATQSDLVINGQVSGIIIGQHAMDALFYGEYLDAAFSLEVNEVSDIIKISGTSDSYTDGYYVLVNVEKDDDYYNAHKGEIKLEYIENEMGKILYTAKQSLIESFRFADGYSSINHKEISK